MKEETFKKGLKMLYFNFQRHEDQKTDEFEDYLALELKDVSDEAFFEGVRVIVNTRKYPSFPTVGEIKDACIGLSVDPHMAIIEIFRRVYDGSKEAISPDGYSHPIVEMTVQAIGGMRFLKDCSHSELNYIKRDIVSTFNGLKQSFTNNPERFKNNLKIIKDTPGPLTFKDGKLLDRTKEIGDVMPKIQTDAQGDVS